MSSNNFAGTNDNNSAILVLDETATMSSSAAAVHTSTTASQPDGHQILDQVQLQFVPTGHENLYVSGPMSSAAATASAPPMYTSSNASSNAGNVVITSGMEKSRHGDTDFLVDNMSIGDPISLTSPVSDPGGKGAGGDNVPPHLDPNRAKYSVWQIEYYARYFDLTTDIFLRRVLWSFLPLTGGNKGTYIDRHIQSNPDLFGPIWISLTLIYTISICNDILAYYNSMPAILPVPGSNTSLPMTSTSSSSVEQPQHHLDFRFTRVNILTTITFTYVFLVPAMVWSFCQWRRCVKLYTFLECLCAYGYSLSIFVPVTILSLVNVREVQFILFVSAEFLSGIVLLISFAPVVHSDPSRSFKFAYVMLIFILVAHLLLGLLYMYAFL